MSDGWHPPSEWARGWALTIFDATKVTYNMYTCAISGMSREIMKMDGRDSAECQNREIKGHNGHF